MFCRGMGIISNYKEYRKNKPKYKDWADNRTLQEAKRLEYIKNNPINPEIKKLDTERAKTILNAVDTMDEFSQSRAEEMEMTIQAAKSAALEIGSIAGMGLTALSLASKNIRQAADSLVDKGKFSPLLIIPAALYLVPTLSTSTIMSIFSAKMETRASRLGRAEAMNKKLISSKQFATLTDEQNAKVQEIAKNINITAKDAKKENKATKGLGVLQSIKILISKDKESEQRLKEINNSIEKDLENVKKDQPLSLEQIEEAKKDKQLIQNVIEKIDIASQDYAEDVELATGTFTALALGSGGGIGLLTKAILNKAKIPNEKSTMIAGAIGLITTLAGAIWATSIQKEASRVARFKVKQDFLANPDKFIYVDDEKIKNNPDVKTQQEKKPNFFKFLIQVYKDNKEYKKYQKENQVKQLKISKAREQIELTPEQEKRAKQLQNNVFKMFHKADEKSQIYSESTEAIGEIVESVGGTISMIPGLIGLSKGMNKVLDINTNGINKKHIFGTVVSFVAMLVPPIILNILVTKEQKSASKVANMLAIDEMNDYKNFADYTSSEIKQAQSTASMETAQQGHIENTPDFSKSPLLKELIKKYSEK